MDWSGTFEDLNEWPDDSFIRDVRLRLAGNRAVVGTRWPLNDDLRWEPGVVPEVDYLATRPIAVLDWPAVPGWDDHTRRLALRYYAGVLRTVADLFRSGLCEGVLSASTATIENWERELVKRRRECADAIVDLRLGARVGWQRDPPEWDGFFHGWRRFLLSAASRWRAPVPTDVFQVLAGHATEVAAVAANVSWQTSRSREPVVQRFTFSRGDHRATKMEVYALHREANAISSSEDGGIALGLVTQNGNAEIRLTWEGARFTGAGGSSALVPDNIQPAIAFSMA